MSASGHLNAAGVLIAEWVLDVVTARRRPFVREVNQPQSEEEAAESGRGTNGILPPNNNKTSQIR